MNAALGLYRALTGVTEPLAGAVLRLGAREEPGAFHAERRGLVGTRTVDTWWHAASLGEVAALEPVLERARRRMVAGRIAVTTTTVTGRSAARRLWGEAVTLGPLDFPGAVRRAFGARDPGSLILVETELWPNWLAECRRRGTAVAVVNGRLSDRSLPRYARLRLLFRPLLAGVQAVAARSELDAARFRTLGVPAEAVRVTGNTKHDRLAGAAPAALPWPEGPVWTVGSLRPGEEEPVLAAFASVRARHPDLRLVLALRHPRDWPGLERLLAERGLPAARRSRPAPEDGAAAVLIADTLGELPALYAAATAAFVGGTLVPVGGHNVLEAAAAGVPVLFGPHTANVAGDAEALLAGGGAVRVDGAEALASTLAGWLDRPRARAEAAAAAGAAVEALRGASDRALDWLVERGVLPPKTRHD